MKQEELLSLHPLDKEWFERTFSQQGYRLIAGVDEVGRGCLAGPVVAAAVVLPIPCPIQGIDDSKKLSSEKREALFPIIQSLSFAFAIVEISPQIIDELNILHASLEAMRQAIAALKTPPDFILIDGNRGLGIKTPQRCLIKGDGRSVNIGAASILAKVHRDRLMAEYEKNYPAFQFSVHKGYGTKLHLEELNRMGPSPIHRKSFRPVTEASLVVRNL